jgi:hypothetical protein
MNAGPLRERSAWDSLSSDKLQVPASCSCGRAGTAASFVRGLRSAKAAHDVLDSSPHSLRTGGPHCVDSAADEKTDSVTSTLLQLRAHGM